MKMIPGMNRSTTGMLKQGESQLKRRRSHDRPHDRGHERKQPQLLGRAQPSRRRRMAPAGSGHTRTDVDKVLRRFSEMRDDAARMGLRRPARDEDGIAGMGVGFPGLPGANGWWHAGMGGLPGQQGTVERAPLAAQFPQATRPAKPAKKRKESARSKPIAWRLEPPAAVASTAADWDPIKITC